MFLSNALLSFGIAKVDNFSLPPNFFAKIFNIFSYLCKDISRIALSSAFKLHFMDIDLLSKMVKEIILDNDRVVLPGLGCFVAELVPSTFSDKGYTINPPYRRLYFRSSPDQGDELIRFYATSNRIETQMADRIITDFVSELKSVLHTKKTVVFPGLGRLRATKENNVFFVADEDLDIYPDGFGLEPISLKTNQETAEEVSAAVVGLKSLLEEAAAPAPVVPEPERIPETVPEPLPEPEPAPVVPGPTPEPAVTLVPEPVTKPKKKVWKRLLWIVLTIVIISALLFCVFIAMSSIAPELLDRILYTKEELDIINYQL